MPDVDSSHEGSQALLPVASMLNTLLNWDLKSWCSCPRLLGSSCFFMNFLVWFPVTWKFDSFSTFDCISRKVHAILWYILLIDVLWTYPCCGILSISLVLLLLFLNLFILFCTPPVTVDNFSLESWNCYLAKSAVLSHQGKNIFLILAVDQLVSSSMIIAHSCYF